MIHKTTHFVLFILLFSLQYFTFAAEITQSNSLPAERQFDFWVGKWNVYSGENLVGTNRIVFLQNKNVIQENWISEKANFTGTSYSFYNPKTDKWQQVWIDINGNNLLLTGQYKDGQMVMSSGVDSNMGEPNSKHRISWLLLPNGDVKQTWESTIDNGKNWTVQFEGIYKKVE